MTPKPTPQPTPKPTPKPTPTPTGPKLVQVDGTWNSCSAGGFCLGGTTLDLGPIDRLDDHAEADFDKDGTVETNLDEFTGLVGKHVSLQVERSALGLVVYVIDGHGYRNADGSFARSARLAPAEASATPTP